VHPRIPAVHNCFFALKSYAWTPHPGCIFWYVAKNRTLPFRANIVPSNVKKFLVVLHDPNCQGPCPSLRANDFRSVVGQFFPNAAEKICHLWVPSPC